MQSVGGVVVIVVERSPDTCEVAATRGNFDKDDAVDNCDWPTNVRMSGVNWCRHGRSGAGLSEFGIDFAAKGIHGLEEFDARHAAVGNRGGGGDVCDGGDVGGCFTAARRVGGLAADVHLEPVVTREKVGENVFGTRYVAPNGMEIFQEVLAMFERAFVGSFEEGVEVD